MIILGPKTAVVMENFRSLTIGLAIFSYLMLFGMEIVAISLGIVLGAYYGIKIERETYGLGSTPELLEELIGLS